jgi:DNA-binding PadR family transcriptional regulator
MAEILDEIDKNWLRRSSEYPGSALAEIFAPLLEEIFSQPSARTLYDRLCELKVHGFIDVYRTARRGRTLTKIIGKGKAAITGREEPVTHIGARSP